MSSNARSLVFAVTAVAVTVVWLRPSAAQQQQQEPIPLSKILDAHTGRFQIVKRDALRAETWLLDTADGRVWRLSEYAEVPGKPTVWQLEERIDSDEQMLEFVKRGQALMNLEKLKNKPDAAK